MAAKDRMETTSVHQGEKTDSQAGAQDGVLLSEGTRDPLKSHFLPDQVRKPLHGLLAVDMCKIWGSWR